MSTYSGYSRITLRSNVDAVPHKNLRVPGVKYVCTICDRSQRKMRKLLFLFYAQCIFCQKNETDSVFDILVFDPRTKGSGGSVSQIDFSWFGPKLSEHVKVAQMKTPSEFDYDRTNMCSFQLFGKSYIIGGYGKDFQKI